MNRLARRTDAARKRRDLTGPQFAAALEKHGMTPVGRYCEGLVGYVNVNPTPKGGGLHVYAPNAGPNRRAQLAYLLREQERDQDRKAQMR